MSHFVKWCYIGVIFLFRHVLLIIFFKQCVEKFLVTNQAVVKSLWNDLHKSILSGNFF